jgi:hypothetical protein
LLQETMRSAIKLCEEFKEKNFFNKVMFHKSHDEKFDEIFEQLSRSMDRFGMAMQVGFGNCSVPLPAMM